MISVIWIWFLTFFITPQEKPTIDVYQVEKGRYVEVWAKNSHFYPVTVHLDVEEENMKSDRVIPLTTVVPHNTEKLLTRMYPGDPQQPWEYRTKYASYMGDIFAKPDKNFAYRLPYKLGDTFKVTQSYGGEFSHFDVLEYSLDFDLPEGTPVLAARGGMVVGVKEDSDEGGASRIYEDQANFVTILHSDGTFADYSHLQLNSVKVKIGDSVREGQLLGLSGSTGFVTGPHLHFDVKMVQEGGKYVTIPVKFATKEGTIELQEKESYTGW